MSKKLIIVCAALLVGGGLVVWAVVAPLNKKPSRPEQPDPIPQAEPLERPKAGSQLAPPGPAPPGMVWIPGGSFHMGSNDGFPDEQPVHEVEMDGCRTHAAARRFCRAGRRP